MDEPDGLFSTGHGLTVYVSLGVTMYVFFLRIGGFGPENATSVPTSDCQNESWAML